MGTYLQLESAVSDTASKDVTADKSGPVIKAILSQHGCECKYLNIVPDDEERIRETVRAWCAEGTIDLVITTGGTGFGVRDSTPEVNRFLYYQVSSENSYCLKAISSLIERPAPGLVHLILADSLKQTPFAALSRPVAGTIGQSLVITLPGSVKAVKENLEALLTDGLLTHAIDLIRGGSGKEVHARLGSTGLEEVGTSHGHPEHDHHRHIHKHSHHSHGQDHGHAIPKSRTTEPLSQDPSVNGTLLVFQCNVLHTPYPCHGL